MMQNRIEKKKPALEKSSLNDIEYIRMDQNYFYFLCCSWSDHLQGDTWFIVYEFLSTTLKGNWVIAQFDRSEVLSHVVLTAVRQNQKSFLYQFQHESPNCRPRQGLLEHLVTH